MATKKGYFDRKTLKDKLDKGNDYDSAINLKDRKRVYVHMIPGSQVKEYGTHFFWTMKEVENERGKKSFEAKKEIHTCLAYEGEACPTCDFLKKLSKDDEIDNDEVIVVVGEGRTGKEICKGDLLGLKQYGYMDSMKVQTSYLYAVVDHDEQERQRALQTTAGLAKKIDDVIDSQIEELDGDEEKGDPFIDGDYAIKLTYDKDAKMAGDKYKAEAALNKTCTDQIEKTFDLELIDLDEYRKKPDKNDMLRALNEIVLEDFLELFEIPEYEEKEEKSKKEEKSSRSKKTRDDEDDEEEEKSSRSSRSRKSNDEEDKKSSRSRKSSDDEEEKPTSGRRNRSSNVDTESSRSRKSSDDEEEKSSRTRKGRRTESNDDEEEKSSRSRKSETSKSKSKMLECPVCDELVDSNDITCKYCGADLED